MGTGSDARISFNATWARIDPGARKSTQTQPGTANMSTQQTPDLASALDAVGRRSIPPRMPPCSLGIRIKTSPLLRPLFWQPWSAKIDARSAARLRDALHDALAVLHERWILEEPAAMADPNSFGWEHGAGPQAWIRP